MSRQSTKSWGWVTQMTVEFHGQPNYTRALDLLLRMEAERHGTRVERVVWHDGDIGNHRRYDGERVDHASGRMAG